MVYEIYMTLTRLALICCPNGCTEEICKLQFASSSIKCTIRAQNVSGIGHQNWPKLSIFVIVWSLLDIVLVLADMFPTYIY